MVAFLHAKGLDKDYFATFGTAFGALRDGTIMPWTVDTDLGVSVKVTSALESLGVRQEMFKYGYYFFYKAVWRVCPHAEHPSPVFQKAIGLDEVIYEPYTWPDKAYVDMYSAAPASTSTSTSTSTCKHKHLGLAPCG